LIVRYREAMRSAPDKLAMADAIAAIRKCAEDGVQIIGLDGFVAVPDGFLAPLDLLLDVSDKGLTADQAAAQAEGFVLLKDRPNVLWEVWTEHS
jgi:hypothetical protein